MEHNISLFSYKMALANQKAGALEMLLFFKVFNILNYGFLSILLLSANSINKFIYFFFKKKGH